MPPNPKRMSLVDEGCTDGDLVTALCEERNVMAFELLMKRYQRPLFGFIRRQVGDRSQAEDLFQQTFLRIFDRIDTCRDPDAFKPWAFGIAANVCRHEGRRQLVRKGEEPSDRMNGHAGWTKNPEQEASTSELRRRIEAALMALPPGQREVFVLYHYSRLAYDDIAQVLAVPVGTVKSRMNAALTQLRGLLAGLKEA